MLVNSLHFILFQVKIKYDLFLTPSMELLYADPNRTNVKKTSVFYRLEKITISHADPKFIRLLEEGGAQVFPNCKTYSYLKSLNFMVY